MGRQLFQNVTQCQNFTDIIILENGEITGHIAILSSITDIHFRSVASVDYSTANNTSNCIQSCHTNTGRSISSYNCGQRTINLRHCSNGDQTTIQSLNRIADIDSICFNTENIADFLRVMNIFLSALRHHNTNHSILAQGAHKQSGRNCRILAAGNADDSLGIFITIIDEIFLDSIQNMRQFSYCVKSSTHFYSSK